MLTVNRALLDLFAQRRVFHRTTTGERWKVGERLFHAADCELEPYSQLHVGHLLPRRLGAFSYANCPFGLAQTTVGRYCSLARDVLWMAPAHPTGWASSHPFSFEPRDLQGMRAYLTDHGAALPFPVHPFPIYSAQGVSLGHDVWIGAQAAIRDGVSIGDGAIVAARAVVTKDVPPYAIVAGSPARVVRLRFAEPLVERFVALQWWRFGPDQLQPLDVREPAAFLDRLEQAIADGAQPFAPAPLTLAEMQAAAGTP